MALDQALRNSNVVIGLWRISQQREVETECSKIGRKPRKCRVTETKGRESLKESTLLNAAENYINWLS